MTAPENLVLAAVLLSPPRCTPSSSPAHGPRARTSAPRCSPARDGNRVDFTRFSGLYGAGFVAEADRLRGKFESCLIKSRKESGQTINLVVACASGIMLSNVQFFLKVLDDNTVSRDFPGMEVTYHRCQI